MPVERSSTLRDAVRGAAFWWLTGALALATFAAVAATVHLIPYLLDQGYRPEFAATATGLVGGRALPGRLIFTPLGNRLEEGLAAHQATTLVARDGTGGQGSAALELYGEAALLRSVAVVPARRGQGWGQRLTEAALELARRQGVRQVYLLTETAGQFCPRLGFVPTSRSRVPPAVQQSVEFTTLCPASALVMVKHLPDPPPSATSAAR